MCARVTLTDEEVSGLAVRCPTGEIDGKATFLAVYAVARLKRRCPHCQAPRPVYTRLALTIKADWPADTEWACDEERVLATPPFTAATALSILRAIPDQDAQRLGFRVDRARPRDLVLTQVLVIPPIARPAIMASEGSRARGQDDLTHKLQEVNKRSIELRTLLAQQQASLKNTTAANVAGEASGELAPGEEAPGEEAPGDTAGDTAGEEAPGAASASASSSVPAPAPRTGRSGGGAGRNGKPTTTTRTPLSKDEVHALHAIASERVIASASDPSVPPPSAEVLERWSRLQCDVYAYVSNNIRGQSADTRRQAAAKSITDRLRGKEGRIRGNLMGKRVNFSARSVITPDPIMDVDQVGVPHKIAMCLTIPEVITPRNIQEMRTRVLNGTTHIVGAESLITADNIVIQLESCADRAAIRLQYGWVVERFLKNNDYVIFNRQPSLHRMGMMGHRVVLVTGSTFRVNLAVANAYNADFDGDEMNMHVVQSPAAIAAQVAALMSVPKQLISPQDNKPCMGIVQDTLLGAHLLTLPGVFLERHHMMQYAAWIKYPTRRCVAHLPPPAISRPRRLWTGAQLISLLLPCEMVLLRCSDEVLRDVKVPRKGDVIIRHGELLAGTLSKATIGTASNGIVDVMYRDFGPYTTVRFMGDMQRVVNQWLMKRGFSVGISDCVLNDAGQAEIAERVQNAFQNTSAILKEPIPGELQGEAEATVMRILSKLLVQTGDSVQTHLAPNNSIASMVRAGSKGNPINLSQICGCVGQQSINGGRIHSGSSDRTLACFAHDEVSINANGFVQSYNPNYSP